VRVCVCAQINAEMHGGCPRPSTIQSMLTTASLCTGHAARSDWTIEPDGASGCSADAPFGRNAGAGDGTLIAFSTREGEATQSTSKFLPKARYLH
jgi:hypothetical protein